MDIALIGYGKMGKAIEEVALQRGHHIAIKISSENQSAFTEANLQIADVAIEFTNPSSAFHNILTCFSSGIPVVCGTTGWNAQLPQAKERCLSENGAFLPSSNFSIGVNLFFEVNKHLADLMKEWKEYEIEISETHHTEKQDAPSGTAITLAEQILQKNKSKESWQLYNDSSPSSSSEIIPIHSFRENNIPGTHQVKYSSLIDDIEIRHTAHSRKGFALGVILAAEFLKGKKGIYSMKDVLFPNSDS